MGATENRQRSFRKVEERNTATKEPIAGVDITLIAPNAPRRTRGQASGTTSTTDSSGRFTFMNVAPATYTLRGTIVVGTEPPAPVEIVLARPAATILGTVRGSTSKPVPSAQVVLVPEGRRRENFLLYKKAIASADGQFTLGSLAPGQYRLFAFESLPSGAERNSQFMARFEQFGQSVTLNAGSTISNIVLSVVPDRQ